MQLVADVHGAFGALRRVGQSGDTVLILGDLVNLIDYRTMEGIVPSVVGTEIVQEVVDLRTVGHLDKASEVWRERTAALGIDVRREVGLLMRREYEAMAVALGNASGFATYGNVDDPELLEAHLPSGMTFVDAEVVEIGRLTFGFVGGGVPRIGSRGEVLEDEMRQKLESIGPVDVLCTHVPPAIDMLAADVIASPTKGSRPILDYIDEYRPRFHFFGDVHQPRAAIWQRGGTRCVNVGYFRATGRPYTFRHGD